MADNLHCESEARDRVRAYHELSKHSFVRYAPGPAGLDWEGQPDPFRRFAGCAQVRLPLTADRVKLPFSALHEPSSVPAQPLCAEALGIFLELSLAISAWKSLGSARWAVRCNPSSGNLHPVEAYLLLPQTDLGPSGLYHYEAKGHGLERRCTYDAVLAERLSQRLAGDCFLAGLSLIPWREAWKYGVRAWRYCQLDLGHAVAALGYAAACNGWQARLLKDWPTEPLARLLGLDRKTDFEPDEPEYPAALLMLGPAPGDLQPHENLLDDFAHQDWQGKANRLDYHHLYRWDAVDEMAGLNKPRSVEKDTLAEELPALPPLPRDPLALDVIRRRRSARGFDPRRSIDTRMFYRLLDGCRPRPGTPPWDQHQGEGRLHLLLFVHRVEGLDPGLYLLTARPGDAAGLRPIMRPELTWDWPRDCPDHLPCYHLISADARQAAMQLGCHQRICADSAFAVAMLGEFDAAIEETPAGYDRLLCEAGRVGQALYLNAQAEGIGSSGIGCFFDDPIHRMLGLKDQRLQALYMFTVGPALSETGVIDEPAYAARGGCAGGR